MICPKCNEDNTSVSWSRSYGPFVRRRRKCNNCGYKYNTAELNGILLDNINNCVKRMHKNPEGGLVYSSNDIKDLVNLLNEIPEMYTRNDK